MDRKTNATPKSYLLLVLCLILASTGCHLAKPTATPVPMVPTHTPSATTGRANTPTHSPTLTPTASPSSTASAKSSPSDTATATASPSRTATATATPTRDWRDLETQCQALNAFGCQEAQTISAPLYEITATIQIEPAVTISGHMTLHFVNTSGTMLDALYLRLYPNAATYGGEIEVDRVRIDGAPVSIQIMVEDTIVRVDLPALLPPMATVELTLQFATRVPQNGGAHYQVLHFQDGIAALANFYPILVPYDDEGWDMDPIMWQGDSSYCDIAFYDVRLRAPHGATLVSSGRTIAQSVDGPWTDWRMVTGPVREFGLALGLGYEMVEMEQGDVRVRSFSKPENAASAQKMLQHAADALRIYAERFGPYPYNEFDVVEAPIAAGGMELPGMTLIQPSQYGRSDGYDEFVVAHEVAHQWWYNLVGNDQQEEPWIDEALTNYAAIIYFEEQYQRDEDSYSVNWYLRSPYQRVVDAGLDLPTWLPVNAYEGLVYYRVVYAKGGLFYHALRERLGDAAFFALLRDYLADNRYAIIDGEQVLAHWQRQASQPIDDLIERWLAEPES